MNKIIMIASMLVGSFLLFGANTVLADGCDGSYDDDVITCILEQIIEQNETIIDNQERIIELEEFEICLILHKDTKGYTPPKHYGWGVQNHNELIEECGGSPFD